MQPRDRLHHLEHQADRLQAAAELATWEHETAGAIAAAIRDQLTKHPPPSPGSRADAWLTWARHLEAGAVRPAVPVDPDAH